INTPKPKENIEKASNNFLIILMLFASPALLPIGFALAITFFVIVVVSGTLMISFMAAALGLIIGMIPSVISAASSAGVGGAFFAGGLMLLLAGVFGFLSIIFYYLTKSLIVSISKWALSLYNKITKKEMQK
ncbi:MAG: hypothetical protein ACOCWI_02425, partial [Bacillota bacterium]